MIIKQFKDGAYLEYAEGSFDEWCVYMVNPAKHYRNPPRDIDYFLFLSKQATRFGGKKIYDDFVAIYNLTGKNVEPSVLEKISQISEGYDDMKLQFDKIFSILYMGMIAEENKAGTRLGKKIKRLGVYKLLVEGCSVDEAANFMRGMGWREIYDLCRERGF